MENFMEYHIMGSVSQIQLKTGCLPSKFDCQSDMRNQTSSRSNTYYYKKKQKTKTIEECSNELIKHSIPTTSGFSSVCEDPSSINQGKYFLLIRIIIVMSPAGSLILDLFCSIISNVTLSSYLYIYLAFYAHFTR